MLNGLISLLIVGVAYVCPVRESVIVSLLLVGVAYAR